MDASKIEMALNVVTRLPGIVRVIANVAQRVEEAMADGELTVDEIVEVVTTSLREGVAAAGIGKTVVYGDGTVIE